MEGSAYHQIKSFEAQELNRDSSCGSRPLFRSQRFLLDHRTAYWPYHKGRISLLLFPHPQISCLVLSLKIPHHPNQIVRTGVKQKSLLFIKLTVASNTFLKVSISYKTHPNAHMSLFWLYLQIDTYMLIKDVIFNENDNDGKWRWRTEY